MKNKIKNHVCLDQFGTKINIGDIITFDEKPYKVSRLLNGGFIEAFKYKPKSQKVNKNIFIQVGGIDVIDIDNAVYGLSNDWAEFFMKKNLLIDFDELRKDNEHFEILLDDLLLLKDKIKAKEEIKRKYNIV